MHDRKNLISLMLYQNLGYSFMENYLRLLHKSLLQKEGYLYIFCNDHKIVLEIYNLLRNLLIAIIFNYFL